MLIVYQDKVINIKINRVECIEKTKNHNQKKILFDEDGNIQNPIILSKNKGRGKVGVNNHRINEDDNM